MSRVRKLCVSGLLSTVVLGLLTLGAPRAFADSVTYYLTAINAGVPLTGPFVSVTVELTSPTTANVTFTSLTNGGYVYLMGSQDAAGVNVNGAFTASAVNETTSYSAAGFVPDFSGTIGSGNIDGFGTFNLIVENDNGFGATATSISFTITRTDGTWSSAANVLTPNNEGAIAGSHVFPCPVPGCNSTLSADLGERPLTRDVSTIPEPGTLIFMGTGLVMLGGIVRRRKKSLS